MARPYHVYVLWSPDAGRFYIGVSANPSLRLQQHNQGKSRWSKRYAGTWRMVWTRPFPDLSEARRFENLLKKQKGGQGFWNLTQLDKTSFDRKTGS